GQNQPRRDDFGLKIGKLSHRTSIKDGLGRHIGSCGPLNRNFPREKTGKGAHVDIAMFDSTISFLEHGLMAYVATGKAPERIGNRHPYMSPFDVFNTKDKPITICCGNDSLFSKLCQSIELPSLIKDPRFLTNIDRVKNQEQLKKLIEHKLKEHNADYWINAIDVAGVPAAPLLSVAEAMQLPQTQARNMLIEAGGIKMPGNPIKISSYPDPKERKGAPELNEHGEILRKEFS
ncbi:CoA transferase, partial [Providencia rustigianii]|uniref:CoA transferase n=1 Tax=Providencia rustigianii TaxID=158850 RepID=UPI00223F2907